MLNNSNSIAVPRYFPLLYSDNSPYYNSDSGLLDSISPQSLTAVTAFAVSGRHWNIYSQIVHVLPPLLSA
ncbi:hypothetical protein MY4824_007727 [Beauveria thailandica]